MYVYMYTCVCDVSEKTFKFLNSLKKLEILVASPPALLEFHVEMPAVKVL